MKRRYRSTPAPNRAQLAYHHKAIEQGCIVCRFRIANGMQAEKWGQGGHTELHHRNFNDWHGGKRLGQDFVVALCRYHHQGDWRPEFPPLTGDEMREVYGPSFKHAADFRVWTDDVLPGYGRGTEAWQRYQDELLEGKR